MKVKITKSKENYWYKDAIGREFDVTLRVHPTFGNKEFILSNTEANQSYFGDDKSSLLVLKSGHYGIAFENGEVI